MRSQRLAAGAAAGHAPDRRVDAELAQQLERVAQPVRDAFQHRAHERARVVAEREPDERAARVRVGVRRALAREVRLEEEALGPGRPALGRSQQLVVGLADDLLAQPAQRAGGAQHHAHRVPAARDRVAERVHARCGIGRERRQRGEDDARRAEHDRDGARPVDPDAERAGGLVARARRAAGRSGDSNAGGSHSRGTLERVEDVVRPAPLGDVEEQRPGRVGGVDRALARQAQAHVVLRQQHVPDALVHVRLVVPQPEELRRREPRERAVARQLDQPREADALLDLRALGGGALVVPEDRGPQHAVGRVERDEPVHLAGEADRGRRGQPRASARSVARHQSSGSCSDQPGCGVESGYSSSALASTSPSGEIASALTAVVPTSIPTRVGSAAMEIGELRPRLWHWRARHPEWEKDGPGSGWEPTVESYAYVTPAGDELVLVDPLVPADDAERFWDALERDVEHHGPPQILLTVFYHERSAPEILERHGGTVWSDARTIERLERCPRRPTRRATGCPAGSSRTTPWDGASACSGSTSIARSSPGTSSTGGDEVRLCPDDWFREEIVPDDVRRSLAPLLELPVELVLTTHGEPVLEDAHAALARALEVA